MRGRCVLLANDEIVAASQTHGLLDVRTHGSRTTNDGCPGGA